MTTAAQPNSLLPRTQSSHKKTSKEAYRLTTLSLFAGGGGIDLGFSAAGFKIACSTDIDTYSCKTLAINSGKKRFYSHAHTIPADIQNLRSSDLLSQVNGETKDIHLVLGGPPCQAFSVFGKRRGLEDPRGNLVWEFLRIIQEVQPEAFVFENVAGLKSIHGGSLYKEILGQLALGDQYTVSAHHYEMADFGIPQFRNRVFFIGARNGASVPEMEPTHGPLQNTKREYRVVKEALRNLPEPGPDSTVPNHIGRVHSQRIIDRYRRLEYGERDSKTRINKLHPRRPSFAIIVGSDNGGGKGHVHPFVPREVTPRESARLQTFPDWWEFHGSGRHVIRQVGNAVPPLFAALLAEHVKAHVFGMKFKWNYKDFVEILELGYLRE